MVNPFGKISNPLDKVSNPLDKIPNPLKFASFMMNPLKFASFMMNPFKSIEKIITAIVIISVFAALLKISRPQKLNYYR